MKSLNVLMLCIVSLSGCHFMEAQPEEMNNVKTINNFLDALFDGSIPSRQIVHNFLEWKNVDSEINSADRIEGLTRYIQLARTDSTKSDQKMGLIHP